MREPVCSSHMSTGNSSRIWSIGPNAPYMHMSGLSNPLSRRGTQHSKRRDRHPPVLLAAGQQLWPLEGRIPCRTAASTAALQAHEYELRSMLDHLVATSSQHHHTAGSRQGSRRWQRLLATRVMQHCVRARCGRRCTAPSATAWRRKATHQAACPVCARRPRMRGLARSIYSSCNCNAERAHATHARKKHFVVK